MDGVALLALGRPTEGGIWGYWFCADCNGRTGVWDEEYIRVQRWVVSRLNGPAQAPRHTLIAGLLRSDVGAFVRAMWAWSFALVPNLRDQYPDVAESVRTGALVEPPADIELLLGVTMSPRIWVAAQPDAILVTITGTDMHHRASGLLVPGGRTEQLPITAVASPPFTVLLARTDRPAEVPHSVANAWLLDPAGIRREVDIAIPIVSVADGAGPAPITYSKFRQGETARH